MTATLRGRARTAREARAQTRSQVLAATGYIGDPRRTIRSAVALLAYALFGVAAWTGQPEFLCVAGFGALVYGSGAAVALFAAHRAVDFGVAGAMGLGMAVMILGPLLMVVVPFWHPAVYVIGVLVVAGVAHVVVLVEAARRGELGKLIRRGARRANPSAAAGLPELLAVACVVAFGYAVAHAHSLHLSADKIPIGGYLTVIGAGWYVAVAVLAVAVAYYAWRRVTVGVLGAGLLLIVALFSTSWLVYDAPRSQTAEKHIALVQLIMHQGTLDGIIPIYHSWPAFFSASAAGLQAFGADPASFGMTCHLAVIWPLIVALATFTIVASLCRLVGYGWNTAYVVATAASIADVLQQDYFSPQSMGYLLALSTFAVCFARATNRADLATAKGRSPFPSRGHGGFTITWRQVVVVAVLSATIAVTHQFTPFAVIGAIAVFFVLRAFRPRRQGLVLAVASIVPPLLWTFAHWGAVGQFFNLGALGDPKNFTAPRDGPVNGAYRLWVVAASSYSVVGALLVVGLIGLAAGVPRIRNRVTVGMFGATLVGFALVAVNPYGNEGIYRASLFALPWLVLLGLPLWHRMSSTGRRFAHLVLAVVLVVQCGLYIASSAGFDGSNVVRRADVVAYDYVNALARAHPDRTYVVVQMALGDAPWQGASQPINSATIRSELSIPRLDNDADARTYIVHLFHAAQKYVGNPPNLTIFVLLSPANVSYVEAWGRGRAADLKRIYAAMQTNQNLKPISQTGGSIFAELVGIV